MLSPRIRRLKLDYDTLTQRFRNWPLIQLSGTAGMRLSVSNYVSGERAVRLTDG